MRAAAGPDPSPFALSCRARGLCVQGPRGADMRGGPGLRADLPGTLAAPRGRPRAGPGACECNRGARSPLEALPPWPESRTSSVRVLSLTCPPLPAPTPQREPPGTAEARASLFLESGSHVEAGHAGVNAQAAHGQCGLFAGGHCRPGGAPGHQLREHRADARAGVQGACVRALLRRADKWHGWCWTSVSTLVCAVV